MRFPWRSIISMAFRFPRDRPLKMTVSRSSGYGSQELPRSKSGWSWCSKLNRPSVPFLPLLGSI